MLVVDDNPVNLGVISKALTDANIDVAVATDGEMALRVVSRDEPDLVLLDVMMPRLDGFETCRRLKANPATAAIPIIFMTARNEATAMVEGFEAGAVDYVTKPFNGGELIARVRTQLSLRRVTRALLDRNARLEETLRERATAEMEREQLTQELVRRTEELRQANDRLKLELAERERAESVRADLQEQIIAAQQERLLELSTPLIPITDRIVIMPLIGTMDVMRIARATETALKGVSERRATFVILDVTGARGLDASAAQMLVRVGNGLRLLGAQAVITGIRPEMASAFVKLDVSLGTMVTAGALQEGIAYAMKAQGKRSYRFGVQ
ncbi:response regulator [Sorangium sp. So ce1335]|uniref:response regulator n=1 Tax=Sorangium sp. So ce1335 TaxID=3133335 RepID=UPI003F62ED4C